MVSGKKLVICDAETEYAARLAEYLGGKRDLSLQVKICESPEQVLSMRRDTKIDILLADENMKFTEGVLDSIPEVMYLSVFETSAPPDHKPRIYRYQSADAIYTCLVDGLTASGMGDLWAVRKKNRGQLIGYYSPIRRLGQTSQAIKHGIQLAKKSNVLYLNMEPYAGIGGHFADEKERNLSMLLYYAKQETGNPGLLITTLVQQISGMDYIPPVTYPEDLKTVTTEEWLWLLREILERSIYDVLILDIGDCIQGIFDILQSCDQVYMMTSGDRLAVSKLCQYEETLCRHGYGSLWERMIRCDVRRSIKNKNTGAAGSVS